VRSKGVEDFKLTDLTGKNYIKVPDEINDWSWIDFCSFHLNSLNNDTIQSYAAVMQNETTSMKNLTVIVALPTLSLTGSGSLVPASALYPAKETLS
jgi:hypothetical protein